MVRTRLRSPSFVGQGRAQHIVSLVRRLVRRSPKGEGGSSESEGGNHEAGHLPTNHPSRRPLRSSSDAGLPRVRLGLERPRIEAMAGMTASVGSISSRNKEQDDRRTLEPDKTRGDDARLEFDVARRAKPGLMHVRLFDN